MGQISHNDQAIIRIGDVPYVTNILRIITLAWEPNVENGELPYFCLNLAWKNPKTAPPVLIRFNRRATFVDVSAETTSINLPVYAQSISSTPALTELLHEFCRERGIHTRVTRHGRGHVYRLRTGQ